MRGLVLALWVLSVACSHDDSVDKSKCTRLRDHLIDLRLADAAGSDGVDLAQHRTAMKQALGDAFLADCQRDLNVEQLRCAMRATDLHATTDCSKSSAR